MTDFYGVLGLAGAYGFAGALLADAIAAALSNRGTASHAAPIALTADRERPS